MKKKARNDSLLIDWSRKQRICTKCNEKKSFDEFAWDYRRDLPRSWCRVCVKKFNHAYYVKRETERLRKLGVERRWN